MPTSAKLTLAWTSTNAASVKISGVGDGLPESGSAAIATEEASYSLVAVGADGTESVASVISVSTHEDGAVVSGHAEISSGVAALISFAAMKDGQVVTSAVVGDTITLSVVASESTDEISIEGASAGIAETSDGHRKASTTVTLGDAMSGDFNCDVSVNGVVGDSGSVHVDIGAAPWANNGETTSSTPPEMGAPPADGTPPTNTPEAPPVAADGGGAVEKREPPELELVLVDSEGGQHEEEMELKPGQTGRLEWTATNATQIFVNGKTVDAQGGMDIPYNEKYAEPAVSFEVVASNPDNDPVTKTAKVKMEVATVAAPLDFHQYLDFPGPKGASYGYFEVESSGLQIEFAGKFTPQNSTIIATAGWDNGLGLTLSHEFKDGAWKLEPKLKFQTPIDVSGDDPDKSKTWVQISGGAEGSYSWSNGFAVALEILLIGLKVSKEPGGKWEHEEGSLDCTANANWTGSLTVDLGKFEGTVKVSGKLGLKPEWGEIFKQLLEKYGEDLAIDVIIELAIDLSMVAGGIFAIVIAFQSIFDTMELERMRDETIPKLTDATAQGYLDGVNGKEDGKPDSEDPDMKSAYSAGLAAGSNKRATIITYKCSGDAGRFDEWLAKNVDELTSHVRAQTKEKLQKDMWTYKADGYAGSWKRVLPGSDGMTQNDQYYAWIFIIGFDSPKQMGASWHKLWLDHRVYNGSESPTLWPGRNDGDWGGNASATPSQDSASLDSPSPDSAAEDAAPPPHRKDLYMSYETLKLCEASIDGLKVKRKFATKAQAEAAIKKSRLKGGHSVLPLQFTSPASDALVNACGGYTFPIRKDKNGNRLPDLQLDGWLASNGSRMFVLLSDGSGAIAEVTL